LHRIPHIAVAVAHLVEHCAIVELETAIAGGVVARTISRGSRFPMSSRAEAPIAAIVSRVGVPIPGVLRFTADRRSRVGNHLCDLWRGPFPDRGMPVTAIVPHGERVVLDQRPNLVGFRELVPFLLLEGVWEDLVL
jgi:hypothetical protein